MELRSSVSSTPCPSCPGHLPALRLLCSLSCKALERDPGQHSQRSLASILGTLLHDPGTEWASAVRWNPAPPAATCTAPPVVSELCPAGSLALSCWLMSTAHPAFVRSAFSNVLLLNKTGAGKEVQWKGRMRKKLLMIHAVHFH